VEGDFVSAVVGIDDVRVELVRLQAPGGGAKLELSTFLNPVERFAPQALQANEPGLRNICFEVEDLHAIVDRMRAKGFALVGGVADYEDTFRMCSRAKPRRDHRLAGAEHRLTPSSRWVVCVGGSVSGCVRRRSRCQPRMAVREG
jgi:hypothetical protein